MVPRRRVLLDTSFVVALENRQDSHHERAKALDRQLLEEGCVSVLHWGILFEIGDGYARIGATQQRVGNSSTDFGTRRDTTSPRSRSRSSRRGLDLYQARPDKEWGLTDCLSFVVMNHEGITEALTADIHFRQAGFEALLLQGT